MWSKIKRSQMCWNFVIYLEFDDAKAFCFYTNKKIMKDCRSGKVFPSSSNCIMLSIFPQVLHLTDKS